MSEMVALDLVVVYSRQIARGAFEKGVEESGGVLTDGRSRDEMSAHAGIAQSGGARGGVNEVARCVCRGPTELRGGALPHRLDAAHVQHCHAKPHSGGLEAFWEAAALYLGRFSADVPAATDRLGWIPASLAGQVIRSCLERSEHAPCGSVSPKTLAGIFRLLANPPPVSVPRATEARTDWTMREIRNSLILMPAFAERVAKSRVAVAWATADPPHDVVDNTRFWFLYRITAVSYQARAKLADAFLAVAKRAVEGGGAVPLRDQDDAYVPPEVWYACLATLLLVRFKAERGLSFEDAAAGFDGWDVAAQCVAKDLVSGAF